MRVLVIGSNGYWGPNHVRTLNRLNCDVITCDVRGQADFRDYKTIELRHTIDRVVIATPPITHFPIAKYWLENKVPVLIEKPMAMNGTEAYRLHKIAKRNNVKLMVGHTYVFSPVLHKIRERIESGFFGSIDHIDIQWQNLGIFQRGGVILDLAPHPLSIILELMKPSNPRKVVCVKHCHKIRDIADTALISIEWGSFQANLNLSWIHPQKNRVITIVGRNQMLVWDDTHPIDKLRLYDKACTFHDTYTDFGTFQMSYKYGDIISYKIDTKEPLEVELMEFLSESKCTPSGGDLGHGVMRIIDKCNQ